MLANSIKLKTRFNDKQAAPMNSGSTPLSVIVMGVSGCGKSSVGQALADALEGSFADGDDFHTPQNIENMANGIALTDEDRMPWLSTINAFLRTADANDGANVVACSALKRAYRDVLSEAIPVFFVHLAGSFELIEARSKARENHFMNVDLLKSQFDTLEQLDSDEWAVTLEIDNPVDTIVERAADAVREHQLFLNSKQH